MPPGNAGAPVVGFWMGGPRDCGPETLAFFPLLLLEEGKGTGLESDPGSNSDSTIRCSCLILGQCLIFLSYSLSAKQGLKLGLLPRIVAGINRGKRLLAAPSRGEKAPLCAHLLGSVGA